MSGTSLFKYLQNLPKNYIHDYISGYRLIVFLGSHACKHKTLLKFTIT